MFLYIWHVPKMMLCNDPKDLDLLNTYWSTLITPYPNRPTLEESSHPKVPKHRGKRKNKVNPKKTKDQPSKKAKRWKSSKASMGFSKPNLNLHLHLYYSHQIWFHHKSQIPLINKEKIIFEEDNDNFAMLLFKFMTMKT